jgi:predicted AlkP superfamily phosphohydrolase/phosphomutase
LVLLLDAMDPDLARQMMDDGSLPHLAALRARASHARTRNPAAFYVGAVWPTLATGAGPGTHGHVSWTELDPRTYEYGPPPPDLGEAETFWRALDRAGRRVLVIDVPRIPYTPLVHGIAVHDLASHDPFPEGLRTSPLALKDELAALLPPEPGDECDHWPRRTAADVRTIVARLTARIERKVEVLERLWRPDSAFDLVAVGFGDPHCVGHQLWHLHDPAHEHHDPAMAAQVGDPVREVYAQVDRAVGRVVARAGPGTRVLAVLSHGMGPHHDGSHLLDRLLARVKDGVPGQRRFGWFERLLARTARSNPKRGLNPARLWRRLPRRRFRPLYQVQHNDAWAAVRFNVVGRERHGLIAPERRQDAVDWLVDLLARAVDPRTGRRAFTEVCDAHTLCSGARTHALPDVVAGWDRSAPFHALEIAGLGRVDRRPPDGRMGDHRPDGFVIVTGPGIVPGALPHALPSQDVAPTLAAWFGVTLAHADGRPVAAWSSQVTPPAPPVLQERRHPAESPPPGAS